MKSSTKYFTLGSLNIPFIYLNGYWVTHSEIGAPLQSFYVFATIVHVLCIGCFYMGAYKRSTFKGKISAFGKRYNEWINRDD